MEITKALKQDHTQPKKYLKPMNSGSADSSKKETALKEFSDLLTKHSDAEEQVAYTALIDTKDNEAKVSAHKDIEASGQFFLSAAIQLRSGLPALYLSLRSG